MKVDMPKGMKPEDYAAMGMGKMDPLTAIQGHIHPRA